MAGYLIEWRCERNGVERISCNSATYSTERRAIAAAKKMFASRHQDLNDELWLYDGRKDCWGNPDENAKLIGKIAWGPCGQSPEFITP